MREGQEFFFKEKERLCRLFSTLARSNLYTGIYECIADVQIPLTGALKEQAESQRAELVERLADVDEQIGELFLMEEAVNADTLLAAIRRATIALKFVPVFMGR